VESINLDQISWPVVATETPVAYEYLRTRGFSDEDIQKYNLRVGRPFQAPEGYEVKKWSGRVLFPVMEGGACRYVVGRTVNGGNPKYVNSTASKSTVVFNLDNVSGDECIICEGIISSIAAQRATGVPAVALLGKVATGYQLSKIRSKCNTVYVSLDGDVQDQERMDLAKLLYRMGFKVFYIDLPADKDPDDLKDGYLEYFKRARPMELLL
jgi:DNA primase